MELSRKGHTVTLVAPRGSRAPPNGELLETVDPSFNFQTETSAFGMYVERLNRLDWDIVHDSSFMLHSYMAKMNRPEIKLLATLHSHPASRNPPPVPKPNLICLSNNHAMMTSASLGVPVKFVYNGIDIDYYPLVEEKGDRCLYLGRMARFKGPHIAVDLAERYRFLCDIVGEDRFVNDPPYVHSLMSSCRAMARYWGEVSEAKKVELLSHAKALIFPAMWQEPFGLTAVEAMACGTPVVALDYPLSAISEIVEDGVNGFLCRTPEEMPKALERVGEIDPKKCRETVEKKFTSRIMAQAYESLYREILDGKEW